MNHYTLKVHVEHGHIENIWSGNDINEAHHYESIGIKHWGKDNVWICLLYTSPSPRDRTRSRMPSSA